MHIPSDPKNSRSSKLEARSCAKSHSTSRGMTLLDTIIGTALMLVVFVGVAGAFRLSVSLVTDSKARAGAIALANDRMEMIKSLPYSSVGTVGGIPGGVLVQDETMSFNGINYARHTYIAYKDDSKDGLASTTDMIPTDYLGVKVQVSWTIKEVTRSVVLVTRISPAAGLESNVPGGMLSLRVVNAAGTAVVGATVHVVNLLTASTTNITTITDASGTVTILGAPPSPGYNITATFPGYSTDGTYNIVTGVNPNPSPGNLTVATSTITPGTYVIDRLGTKTVNTWTQILATTSVDRFDDFTKIATSTGIVISGGVASLATGSTTGEVQSIAFGPTSLATWGTFSWTDTQLASTSIKYRIYNSTGTTLIPDAAIPGNATGFISGSVDLTALSTSTYPSIRLDAVLTASSSTTTSASLTLWSVTDTYGPLPLPNISFTLTGAKIIGTPNVWKYTGTFSSGSTASISVPGLEWDNYTTSVSGAYDIASACNPQPEYLAPGATMTSNFYLAPHTTNSLLVDVRSVLTGALIPGGTAILSKSGFSATSTTDACGQVFFSGLSSLAPYTLTVGASGRATSTTANITVTGTMRQSVVLN